MGELREESKEGVEAELALKIIVLETFAQRDKIWIGMMKEVVELVGLLWVGGRGGKEIAEQFLTSPHWN